MYDHVIICGNRVSLSMVLIIATARLFHEYTSYYYFSVYTDEEMIIQCRAGSPFRGALGNLGVRGPQTPSLPPNQPSNNPFTAIFYTPFLNL